ncbi:hypothetical protein DVA67_031235 [Solirubrobacter sp. CPCC 204708]|nr:hypothetical protein [Solirubrobacter deserti]
MASPPAGTSCHDHARRPRAAGERPAARSASRRGVIGGRGIDITVDQGKPPIAVNADAGGTALDADDHLLGVRPFKGS